MTARKPKTKAEPIEPSHEAEHEQDVVSETKPAARVSAVQVADFLTGRDGTYSDDLEAFVSAGAQGNRLTIVLEDQGTGLVQTFHATIEEGIREF